MVARRMIAGRREEPWPDERYELTDAGWQLADSQLDPVERARVGLARMLARRGERPTDQPQPQPKEEP